MYLDSVALPIFPSSQFTLSEDNRSFSVEASDLQLEKWQEVIRIRYRDIVYSFSLERITTRDGEVVSMGYREPVLGRTLVVYND